jgi:hypothetical protein
MHRTPNSGFFLSGASVAPVIRALDPKISYSEIKMQSPKLPDKSWTLMPNLIFFPVNREVLRPLLKPFLLAGGTAAGASGLGAYLPKFWEHFPKLMEILDIEAQLIQARPIFLHALLFAFLAFIFLLTILVRLLDFQLTLSITRTLVLISVYYVLCATISIFPDSATIHIILVFIVLLVGVFRFYFLGLLGYYWKRKSYGDVFLESFILIFFIFYVSKPIYFLMKMEGIL